MIGLTAFVFMEPQIGEQHVRGIGVKNEGFVP
jgi:hypothetical protein